MSLPSINFLHLTVSEIQAGQTFSGTILKVQVSNLIRYHLEGTEAVAEQHILVKGCKCRNFRVISNLLKVPTSTINHLAMDLDLQKNSEKY